MQLLLRGTGNVGVGTKNATIARLRPQKGAATLAFIEILARVARHRLLRFVAAVRTGDRGNSGHVRMLGYPAVQGGHVERRRLDLCC